MSRIELPPHKKGSRLRSEERELVQAAVGQMYGQGKSIRQIASETGLSIGLTRILLLQAGVQLRPRGGSGRGSTGADVSTSN